MLKTLRKAEKHLKIKDFVMAGLIEKHGPCTLFEENSLIHKSHFHVLVWAIINQQLSVQAARSIEQKLFAHLESDNYDYHVIIRLSDNKLAACGLSRQKIRYLKALCKAVSMQQLRLETMSQHDNKTVSEILTTLPGIGPWTVDMFLMFSLARLDILPLGDLALRKSFALHYDLPDDPKTEDYHRISNTWQPYQSIASWYLWAAVD